MKLNYCKSCVSLGIILYSAKLTNFSYGDPITGNIEWTELKIFTFWIEFMSYKITEFTELLIELMELDW